MRPVLVDTEEGEEGLQVQIEGGRHPVLDLLRGDMVPNDTHLAASGPRACVVTGPNMGGVPPAATSILKQRTALTF